MKYMIALWLVLAYLSPELANAQFSSFEPGAYILASTPTVVQKTELKLHGNDQLIVKDEKGQKIKLTPKEVVAFRISNDKYVAVSQFTVEAGLNSFDVEQGFARLLDSGLVELLEYKFTGYNYSGDAYLLRTASLGIVAVTRGGIGSGKRLRETVRPFLASRPEFIKYLDEKRINIDNLVQVIYALNHDQTFTPPAALNLD